MARHRRSTTWGFSRARHRGPGAVERFAQRGRNAIVANVAGFALVAMIFWSTPSFDHRVS